MKLWNPLDCGPVASVRVLSRMMCINTYLSFVLHQFWRVRILETWCTVTEFLQEAASPWARRYSLSATKATYCLETACLPATTEIRPLRSGARGCPSVSVSPINHPQCVTVALIVKILPLNINFCQAQVCDSISDAFSWEVRAVQKPWRSLHQYAEFWKGLLPSRRDADLLLSPWLWAAGRGHHLLYPWAPFTME